MAAKKTKKSSKKKTGKMAKEKNAEHSAPKRYNLKIGMTMELHDRMKTAATIEGISQNEWLRKLIDKHSPKL
jgi:predicted HicB family RNase H-like nuclease